jgi:hypothetical protein
VLRRYQVDPAIAACDGDAHEAVKALIVANHFLETEFEKLRAAASRAMRVARPTAAARSEGLV